MYNKAIFMGRICNDLEIKTTSSGVNVLSFSIAVDRRYQEKGQEKKSDFFNCVAWREEKQPEGKQAEQMTAESFANAADEDYPF